MYGVPLLLRNQSSILQVRYNDQIADDMTVQPSSPGPLDKWMELLPPEVTEHVELKKLIIPGKMLPILFGGGISVERGHCVSSVHGK